MKQYYETEGPRFLADLLGRSYRSVTRQAMRLGLKRVRQWNQWTAEEEATLRRHYAAPDGIQRLPKMLNKTKTAIEVKAQRLGMCRSVRREVESKLWTESETQRLIAARAEGKPCKRIAEELGRGYLSVCSKIQRLKDAGMLGQQERTI